MQFWNLKHTKCELNMQLNKKSPKNLRLFIFLITLFLELFLDYPTFFIKRYLSDEEFCTAVCIFSVSM